MAATRSLGVTIGVAIGTSNSRETFSTTCPRPSPIYLRSRANHSPIPVAAIFNTKISKLLPEKVAAAALHNGLPASSLKRLIIDLTTQDSADMMKIPGITPAIIGAAVAGLKEAYLDSFHAVWYAGSCFAAVGVICEESPFCARLVWITEDNRFLLLP